MAPLSAPFIAGGTALIVVATLLAGNSTVTDIAALAIALGCSAVVASRARSDSRSRNAWLVLGAGCLATGAAQAIGDVWVTTGAALVIFAGLGLLGLRKRVSRDRDGLTDASIVAVAGVLVTIETIGDDGSFSDYVFPLATLAALAAALRLSLAIVGGTRIAALTSLGPALVWGGSLLEAAKPDADHVLSGDVPTAIILLGIGAIPLAAIDEDRKRLTEPVLAPRLQVNLGRTAVIGIALLTPVVVLVLNENLDRTTSRWAITAAIAALALLMLSHRLTLVQDVGKAREAARRRDRWYRSMVRHSADLLLICDRAWRIDFASPSVESIVGAPSGDVLGTFLTDYMTDADSDRLQAALQHLDDLPDGLHEPVTAEVRIRHVDGEMSWMELSLTEGRSEPVNEAIVLNGRDITEKRSQDAELASAYDKQTAIAALGRAALGGAEPSRLAEVAVARVTRSLGVESCELFRAVDNRLLLEAASGPAEELVGNLVLAIDGGSQAGYTMALGEPVVTSNFTREHRFDAPQYLIDAGLASGVSVGVKGQSHTYGVMVASAGPNRRFGPPDTDFLTTMANELALALERRSAEDETRHQALHDALTGLPNRTMFLNRLDVVTSRGDHGLIGVLFLDLDHFKLVNDSLGHDAGDQLLTEVAIRLRSAMRPSDTVARFGGDEFVVLCEDLDSVEHASVIAARVREHMDPPFLVSGQELHVSASIGIAVTGATSDPEELLSDADAAMYKAKDMGRSRYEVFDFTMRSEALSKLKTESALHRALAEEQLEVHFQPAIDLATHTPIGAEALVRWHHPEWGMVSPDEFVPVAEKTGLIDQLGEWVLRTACTELAKWQVERPEQIRMLSVNLSAAQLAREDLADRVAAIVEETGADPTLLTMEVTESVVMADVNRSMTALHRLKELGLKIAVDDFGTGYSSLAYLRRLPVDILKIDREFVGALAQNPEDEAIVTAIITLAHSLGLTAVAEGVEDAAQAAELLRLGCEYAQGFYFGAAVPADELSWERKPITLA